MWTDVPGIWSIIRCQCVGAREKRSRSDRAWGRKQGLENFVGIRWIGGIGEEGYAKFLLA